MSGHLLGVDGGGTKTEAVICDSSGRVLGRGLGGPSGIDSVGAAGAIVGIGGAVAAARQQAGLSAAPFASVFLGMAGVVSQADREIVRGVAHELALGPNIGVDHDIRISLAGGLSGRLGIALIAGTGSSCFGINAAGERWQSGGWGHLISDEGSSYWFGWNGIRLAIGAYDGRWQSTLLEPIRQRLGIAQMTDILYRLYTEGISKSEIASLAPLVMEAAASGDTLSHQLIVTGTSDLAQMAAAVARRLGWAQTPCEVTLTGGLWRAGEEVIAPFRRALADILPGARIVLPELSPVLGACVLALQQAGIATDKVLLQRLGAAKEKE